MKKNNIIILVASILLIILISFLIICNLNSGGKLIKLSYKEVQNKIDNKETFVLVLSQSTCSHCADYKPKLINIAKENNINIYYLDYDTDTYDTEKILKFFNFDGGTPTTFFYKDGEELSLMDRISGDVSKQTLLNKLKKLEYIKDSD